MLYLIFSENDLIVEKKGDQFQLPNADILSLFKSELHIIEKSDDFFVAYVTSTPHLNESYEAVNVRIALNFFDASLAKKIIYYLQLAHYYQHHQFCGLCGHQLTRSKKTIFMFCEACQHEFYPKLAPCIMVRINKGDQILLARSPHFPAGLWALIAGFVELGESLEDAIHREVKEEIGIEVKNIKYWGSQSWPIPTSSLMIGFTAEYKSGEITIDNNEIEQAEFFDTNKLPEKLPFKASISRQLIDDFLK